MYPKFIAKALFIPLFISICVMTLSACEQNSKEPDTHQAAISSASTPDDLAYQTFLSSLAKNQVLPAYQQLKQAATLFKQTLQTNCNTVETAEPKWSAVQAKWVALNRTWQTIQWLRLGPIKGSNLHSRIQYWPDANGAVERGVGQLFAKDPSPSLSQLSQMNVGAQGLPAAELILFSQLYQAADMQATRCELLLLIATNITEMAKKASSEWQISADFHSQFVQGQGEFSGVKDTFEEIFSTWLTQLTLIKDNKLLYPLGISSPGILALTESPHADVSGHNIHINLLSLKAALQIVDNISNNMQRTGLENLLFVVTGDESDVSIAQRIQLELENAINISAQFPDTFSQQLADKTGRQRVQKLIESIDQLQDLMSVELVDALNLNVGFNSLDGD